MLQKQSCKTYDNNQYRKSNAILNYIYKKENHYYIKTYRNTSKNVILSSGPIIAADDTSHLITLLYS